MGTYIAINITIVQLNNLYSSCCLFVIQHEYGGTTAVGTANRHGRVADPRWNLTAVNCQKERACGRRERQRNFFFCCTFCFQVIRPPQESLPFLYSLRQPGTSSHFPIARVLTGSASVLVSPSRRSYTVRNQRERTKKEKKKKEYIEKRSYIQSPHYIESSQREPTEKAGNIL